MAEEVGPVEVAPLPFELPQREAIVRGFASLDAFELSGIFRRRAVVMRSVPWVLKGAFRSALRIAMEEAVAGLEAFDEVRQDRAWKLFLLLPQVLLGVGWFQELNSLNVLRNLLADSGLIWWRRASEPLRQDPGQPFASGDGKRMMTSREGSHELRGWPILENSLLHVKLWRVQQWPQGR